MNKNIGEVFVGFEGEACRFTDYEDVIRIRWLKFSGGDRVQLMEKMCNAGGQI